MFDTTDEGWLHGKDGAFVGCKLTLCPKKTYIKLTQPVKIQRLIDEFRYTGKNELRTPVKPGSVLASEAENSLFASKEDQAKFAMITGMMLHVCQNSRIEGFFIRNNIFCMEFILR